MKMICGSSLRLVPIVITVVIFSGCAVKEQTVAPITQESVPPPPAPPLPPPAPPMFPAPPQSTIITDPRDLSTNVGDRVLFAFDKSDLDDNARNTLRKQSEWLQQYPDITVTVEGYSDERGTREYNIALGARRAATVRDYLVSLGVATARLRTISFGKERPMCVDSNESCWSQNRRAVSIIAN